MIEMFELLGKLVIDMTKAYRDMEQIKQFGEETANTLQQRFTDAFRKIENLSLSPDINTDDVIKELGSVQALLDHLYRDLKTSGQIDINTDTAAVEIKELLNEVSRLRDRLHVEGDVQLDNQAAMQELAQLRERARSIQTILSDARYHIDVNTRPAENAILSLLRYMKQLDAALQSLQNQMVNVNENINTQVHASTESAPHTTGEGTTGMMYDLAGAGTAAAASLNSFAYDINRVNQQLEEMQQQMLRYKELLNPNAVLQRVRERLDVSRDAMQFLPQAQNMMQLNAVFSMIEQGALAARQELAQLGFGRTKTELEAIEDQIHTMANMRLDDLRDQIKLTEKALKEMKASANADELADEIKKTEETLALYKKQLEEANPVQQIARANGYAVAKIFGKDVLYKPITDQLERIGERITGFFNKDLAYIANKAYTSLDNAAKAIVGPQTTKMEEHLQIQQLATRYQRLGQQINTFVTPAVLRLAAAFGMVASKAEDAVNKFQARTLTSPREMKQFKDDMEDVYVETGAARDQVSQVFSTLRNETNASSKEIRKLAQMGFEFANVWGNSDAQTALTAIKQVQDTAKRLNVSQKQAADALALALKRNNGDFAAAKQELEDYATLYKRIVKGEKISDAEIRALAEQRVNEALYKQNELYKQLDKQRKTLKKQIQDADTPEQKRILEEALKGVEADISRLQSNLSKGREEFLKKEVRQLQEMAKLGPKAFERMTEPTGSIEALAKSLRQLQSAMVELIDALAPTLIKIADGFTEAAKAATEFLRNNPGFAKFVAHMLALSGAGLVLLGIFAPLASFMIRFRGLLQGVAQAMGAAARGGTAVLAPTVRAIFDMLTLTRNAIIGLPRVLAGVFPTLLTMLRALPGAMASFVVQFIKMNPLLSAFAAFAWVAYKNWDRFGPVLKEIWTQLKRIGNAIIEAFAGPGKTGMEGFSAILDQIAEIAGDILLPFLKELVPVLEAIATAMENGGGKVVAFGAVLWLFGGALGKLVPVIGGLGGKLNAFFSIFKKAGTFITGLGGKITRIIRLFRSIFTIARTAAMVMTGPWGLLIAAVVAAVGLIAIVLYKNWDKIKNFYKKIKNYFKNKDLKEIGKDIATGLWNGLKAGLAFVGLGPLILKYLIGPFKKLLGINSPSRLFHQFGVWIIEGLANGLKAAIGIVRSVISSIGNAIRSGFRAAFSAARNIVSGLRNAVSRAFRSMGQAVRNAVNSITRAVSQGFRAARNTAINLVRGMAQSASRLLSSMRQAFSSSIRAIRNAVTNGFRAIRNTVSQMMNAAGRIVSSVLNAMRTRFSRILSSIRSNVRSAFRSVATFVRQGINSAYQAVSRGLSRIGSAFSRLAKRARKWGSDIVNGIVRGIRRAASAAYNAISNVARNISRAFREALGIRSPSRVLAADAYWAPVGVAKGIREGIPEVEKASDEMSKAVRSTEKMSVDTVINPPSINPLDVLISQMAMSIPLSVQPLAIGNVSMPTTANQEGGLMNRDMILTNPLFQIHVKQLMTAEDIKKMLGMVRQEVQNIATDDFNHYARRRM
jgi:phage-related protein